MGVLKRNNLGWGRLEFTKSNLFFYSKNDIKYLLVSIVVFILLFVGFSYTKSFFLIGYKAITIPGFAQRYFESWELQSEIINIAPTAINAFIHAFTYELKYITFDFSMIFSAYFFQLIIPLFAVVSGIAFYKIYNTIFQFKAYKSRKRYRFQLLFEMFKHSSKLSLAMYIPYLIFLLFINSVSTELVSGAGRTLFSDLLGSEFYLTHTVLHFVLEGFILFFLMPFVYSMLAQSIVVLNLSVKEVVAAPLVYYYGFSALGFALYTIVPNVSLYLNPSVLMASGSYDYFNTIGLILVNMVPLFIAIGIVYWKAFYAEI